MSQAVTSNETWEPVWQVIPIYKVTFNLNGGTGTAPTTLNLEEHSTYTLPSSSGFSREGHTFNNWRTTDFQTTLAPGEVAPALTSNQSWEAVWTPKTYTISYTNTGDGITPPSRTVPYGTTFTLPSSSGVTKTGSTFSIWRCNELLVDVLPGGTSPEVKRNLSWTPVWDQVNYQVGFNLEGASGTTPSQISVGHGRTFMLPTSSGITKTGYIFDKWYSSEANKVKVQDSFSCSNVKPSLGSYLELKILPGRF